MNEWFKRSGATHWPAETRGYGKNAYVNGLLGLIEAARPQRVFDVGLGDGFPFAAHLLARGITVHGCDVSDFLLTKLTRELPDITFFRGTVAEAAKHLEGRAYGVVYCLRTSWYFEDLFGPLTAMIELVSPGGIVLFDCMNADSLDIQNFMRDTRAKKRRQKPKVMIKKLLNAVCKTSFTYETGTLCPNYPIYARDVDAFLSAQGLQYEKFSFQQIAGESSVFDPHSMRIIYRVQKTVI